MQLGARVERVATLLVLCYCMPAASAPCAAASTAFKIFMIPAQTARQCHVLKIEVNVYWHCWRLSGVH